MTDNEVVENEDQPRDRARRRLIKLGIYLVPAITSMTAFLRRADATPTPPGAAAAPKVQAQATANPQ